MKSFLIKSLFLDTATHRVAVIAIVNYFSFTLLRSYQRQYSIASAALVNDILSRSPSWLPSIYLFNLKQTKLFAFIID